MVRQLIKDHNPQSVYIAIQPGGTGTWHLEVESTPGSVIGAEYDTGSKSLRFARALADELEKILREKLMIHVYKTRAAWECSRNPFPRFRILRKQLKDEVLKVLQEEGLYSFERYFGESDGHGTSLICREEDIDFTFPDGNSVYFNVNPRRIEVSARDKFGDEIIVSWTTQGQVEVPLLKPGEKMTPFIPRQSPA
jgi:hypothetical protein